MINKKLFIIYFIVLLLSKKKNYNLNKSNLFSYLSYDEDSYDEKFKNDWLETL